ncbi:MAG: ribose-phosphate pyrophosphokinae [Bacteroidota bacterium]|nr:ribose-phosphate pyrophosphokinae [Bacteroidota bacterium]
MNNKLIFSTRSYDYLKQDLLKQNTSFINGEVVCTKFPDGELYQQIVPEVEGKDAVLVGGTISDEDTLELFDLACGLVKEGVISLTLVIPFMAYSTMERAVKHGEVVKAKTRAILLSAIPHAPMGNKVVLLDLHSEGIPHYFSENIRPVHLYCKKIVMEAAMALYGKDFVLCSTDAGRAKWVESLANDMGINAAFVFKRRISGDETKVTSISADVKGKNVVIYDDMIRTGGSLISAARSYHEAGAKEISVITTHGLFTNNAVEKIKQSGIIKQLISTNTHPNVLKIQDKFLKVESVAELIAEHL